MPKELPTLTVDAFEVGHRLFLREMEKHGNNPNSRIAELDARIEKGEEKTAAAVASGVDPEKVDVALNKLATLRQERDEIFAKWVAPHIAWAHMAAILKAAQEFPIVGRAFVVIDIPDIFQKCVELNGEPPF